MSALEQQKIDSPFQADEGYFNEFFRRVQSRVGITPEDLSMNQPAEKVVSEKPVKLQYAAQLKVEFGQPREVETKVVPAVSSPAQVKTSGKENIDKIEIAPLQVEPNPTPAWRNFAAEWSQEAQEEVSHSESLNVTESSEVFSVLENEVSEAQVEPASLGVIPIEEVALQEQIQDPIESEIHHFGNQPSAETEKQEEKKGGFEPAPMSAIPNDQELARLKAEMEKQEQYSRVEPTSGPALQPAFAPITGSNRSQIIMNSLGAVASLVAVFAAYFIWQGIQRPVTIDEYVDTSLASRGIGPVATPVIQEMAPQASVSEALVTTMLEEEALVDLGKPTNVISIEGLSTKGQRAAKALESYDLCVFDDPNPFFEESIF